MSDSISDKLPQFFVIREIGVFHDSGIFDLSFRYS